MCSNTATPGMRRIAAIAAAVLASFGIGCTGMSTSRAPSLEDASPQPRHADATGIGRTEGEARRSAIRAALAQLKPQYVDSVVAVRDDELVEDRIRIFTSQSDVIAQTIGRRFLPNGAIEVEMRVWVDPLRKAPGLDQGEIKAGLPPANPGHGATRIASAVGDALEAEDENALEANLTLADYIRSASVNSLGVQLFHCDGRPFDTKALATGELSRIGASAVAVPVVVRVSRSAGPRSLRAIRDLRRALESSADRVIPSATELLSGKVLSRCPLSGSGIWRGTTSSRGLVRPGRGQRSILLARRKEDHAGDIAWVGFDQYLLPAGMVPADLESPSAVVVSLHDASGRELGSQRVPIAPATYLIDWERRTEPLEIGNAATIEVGGRVARPVSFPFLSWGTHLESGSRGTHLAIHAMALSPGTLAGGATAFAEELEFMLAIHMPRSLLADLASADVTVETAPLR